MYTIYRFAIVDLRTESYTILNEEVCESKEKAYEEFVSMCPPPNSLNNYDIMRLRWDQQHSARTDIPNMTHSKLFEYLIVNRDIGVICGMSLGDHIVHTCIRIVESVKQDDSTSTPALETSEPEVNLYVRLD